jgi:purine-nucleoside phosphorylase
MTIVPSACNEARVGDIAKVVLMPGDPLRAKYVAEKYLESPRCFNKVRNMYGYTGIYKDKQISVMGSGMGIPSMGLYAYELYHYFKVDAIIRIGSAGGLADNIKLRDIVVAMTASTNSNFAAQYNFPGLLAPVADYAMLMKAMDAAKAHNVNAVAGSVYTCDQFYYAQPDLSDILRKFGHLAIEMETAGLYYTAMAAGKKALSILTITDHMFTGEALSAMERQESLDEMLVIALETAWATI